MDYTTTEYFDELDDLDTLGAHRHRRKGKHIQKQPKYDKEAPLGQAMLFDPVAQLGVETEFNPTFTASKFERAWILEYLNPFYEDRFITDVLRQVKGGKEATVYCCQADARMGVGLFAAKVYRPKIFRTLKNDAEYRQGRVVMDEEGFVVRGRREKLAMKKKTPYGQELLHAAWLETEYKMLCRLHTVGADVPKPIAKRTNTILMEYLGEVDLPAPTLNSVDLPREEARMLFERVILNAEVMLRQSCVHADLSAFNILYWEGDIRIIDLPQAVDPYVNPKAFQMFERDILRVCQYFKQYDIKANPRQLARELWERNAKRDTSEVFLA